MDIGHGKIKVTAERDPAKLPWKELGVDVVMECTGIFTKREQAAKHLEAGAKHVLDLGARRRRRPDRRLRRQPRRSSRRTHTIVSNASCTTNCLAPVAYVLHEAFGIERGYMTTIHSYTGDQPHGGHAAQGSAPRARRGAVDDPDLDRCRQGRRPRAARAQGQARRHRDPRADRQRLADRLQVRARRRSATPRRSTRPHRRRPTANRSRASSTVTDEELVSADFNHNPASSTVRPHARRR